MAFAFFNLLCCPLPQIRLSVQFLIFSRLVPFFLSDTKLKGPLAKICKSYHFDFDIDRVGRWTWTSDSGSASVLLQGFQSIVICARGIIRHIRLRLKLNIRRLRTVTLHMRTLIVLRFSYFYFTKY